MNQFVKKPVVVTAIMYEGDISKLPSEFAAAVTPARLGNSCYINTLEGTMEVAVGDWIIKGIEGEFYPCKPSIFAKTYTPEGRYAKLVGDFASLMQEEMELNEPTKGNTWLTDEVEWLLARLVEEVRELTEAVTYDVGVKYVNSEAADIANFAMMIADNYRNNKRSE